MMTSEDDVDVKAKIAGVDEEIKKVSAKIEEAERELVPLEEKEKAKTLDDDDRTRLAALRKEKEQLRKKEEQLREEKLVLLRSKGGGVDALASQLSSVTLSRKSASPEKPLGREIEMSIDGLLAYCREKQADKARLNLNMMCHLENDPAKFELSGRAHAMEMVKEVMTSDVKVNDRIRHPIMVCSGLSGLGKTRMLEEWDVYWKNAGITGKRAAVLVLYENGHGLRSLDPTIGWEASVAWRFLHRVFLEDNMGDTMFDDWFRKELPKNASALTLSMAILVFKRAMVQVELLLENEDLTLFVGIDEYQRIVDFEKLLPAIGKSTRLPGIKVFFMMAGLEWGPLSLARSSNVYTKRIPMSLLDPRSAEAMLDSNEKSRALLSNIICRRHVFFLGGVPRFVEQYAKNVLGPYFEKAPKFDESALSRALGDVFINFVDRAWIFKGRSQLLLTAHALCGRPVNPDDVPKIAVGMKDGRDIVYPDHLNWRQLCDTGVCLLVERGGAYYVDVPYCVLRCASSVDLTFSEKLFARSISALSIYVDNHLFALEPWQLWEKFGACFHALRINALLVVEGKDEMVCPLSDVFAGSLMDDKFQHSEAILRPVKVVSTGEMFSADVGLEVKQSGSLGKWKWLKGESEDGKNYSYVLINGTNGKGVDIFFALQKAFGGGYFIITDQRKRVAANSISWATSKELCSKANIVPKCAGEGSEVIFGIFNVFPQIIAKLPPNCFVVGANETAKYHGCLTLHPASDPRIFVNSDHRSALACVDGITVEIANKIIRKRRSQPFQSINGFINWLKQEDGVILNDDQQNRLVIP